MQASSLCFPFILNTELTQSPGDNISDGLEAGTQYVLMFVYMLPCHFHVMSKSSSSKLC